MRIAASLDIRDRDVPSLSLTASGSFPSAIIGWKMFWDRNWHKQKGEIGGKRYAWWRNDIDNLEMSVIDGNVVLMSNGEIERLLGNFVTGFGSVLPEPAQNAAENSDLFIFLPHPSDIIAGASIQNRVVFALAAAWVSLRKLPAPRADGVAQYLLSGTLILENPGAVRLYTALVKLALAAWLNSMDIGNLKTVQETLSVTTDGANIIFTGITIPQEKLREVLVKMFRDLSSQPGQEVQAVD